MNVGIVGLGKMGLLHAGILNTFSNVKLTTIAEKETMIAKFIKNSLPQITVYNDYKEMIESENLDLVYITTPISLHFPIALLCIKNKINLFLEKPLTKNQNEAEILCSKLKGTHIIHCVGFNRRFLDTFSYTKKLLQNNILGEIKSVKGTMFMSNIFSKSKGWRLSKNMSGGGVLLDFGSHLVDLFQWYCGPIRKVDGQIKSIYSKEVEDEAHMELEFENAVHGTLDTSWSVKGYRIAEINLELEGNNGIIKVNENYVKIHLKKPVNGFHKKETLIYKQSLNSGISFDIGGPEFTKEDEHVVNCVSTKTQSMINIFEASKTQSAIEAMYKSAYNKSSQLVKYVQ